MSSGRSVILDAVDVQRTYHGHHLFDLRTVCAHRGVEINRDKALHSIFGEYVKRLRDAGISGIFTEQ